MSDIVVRAEGLGKQYFLGKGQPSSQMTLRDRLTHRFRGVKSSAKTIQQTLFNRDRPTSQNAPASAEDFWALKDVSFEVARGEIVGIIGRNGAGKSTLLKILSRITEPTTGEVTIEGRVASLLEVGTGFHPELTGRENIFLNGSILGMSRAEIKQKFDEIVAFAEIEQFLETPVKRYSSGMYVRLAFAVAAHLEPDILIVDEVLAVGDTAFQKKCLGKMGDVAAKEGRTVLFVSHNMTTMSALCDRAYLLEKGQVVGQGTTSQVVSQYMRSVETLMGQSSATLEHRQDRTGDGSARLIAVTVEDADGADRITVTSRLRVTLSYRSQAPLKYANFSASIYDYAKNIGIVSLHTGIAGGMPETLPPTGSVTCITEPLYLTPGRCYLNLTLLKGQDRVDYIQYAAYFEVEPEDIYGTGKLPKRHSVFCIREQVWSVQSSVDPEPDSAAQYSPAHIASII